MKIFPKRLTAWQRGWISGLLDSDGALCFNANRKNANTFTTRIQVDNRSRRLIESVLKTVGSGHISTSRTHKRSKGMLGKTFSPMYRWAGGSGVMTWLLPQLRLIGKERQRRIIIQALPLLRRSHWRTETQTARLKALIVEMTEINSARFDRAK